MFRVCACVYVLMRIQCACVSECVRAKATERERNRKREREKERGLLMLLPHEVCDPVRLLVAHSPLLLLRFVFAVCGFLLALG